MIILEVSFEVLRVWLNDLIQAPAAALQRDLCHLFSSSHHTHKLQAQTHLHTCERTPF